MYESIGTDLLPFRDFIRRLIRHIGLAAVVLGVSLAVGMVGYREFAGLRWVDAFLNASMILGGMGPVSDLPNDAAKLFAGCYALYSGVIFIVAIGIMIAPIAHRILHSLHLDQDA
jgi:hypothetical protein